MKMLWDSGKFLLYDMIASLFFLALYAVTKSLPVSVAVGIAVGVGQMGWELARRKPIAAMQWLSLSLVIFGGIGALVAHDVRIILLKPSLVYVVVGTTMLKRGWMNRYFPAEAKKWVPDLGERWGYAWAALMFVSAILNAVLAMKLSFLQWGAVMSAWAMGSKLTMFAVQFTTMRMIGARRARRAMATPEMEALPA